MFDDISVPILSGMDLILFGDNHRLFHSKVRYIVRSLRFECVKTVKLLSLLMWINVSATVTSLNLGLVLFILVFDFFLEIKLYVIVVPCVFGILLVTIIAAVTVIMLRRRRLSSPGNGVPVQMSLLNEDTQLSDSGPHSEASLPVYRPTTRAIKSWRTALSYS